MKCRSMSATFRRSTGEDAEGLSSRERVSIVMLEAARARLVLDNGRLDTQSEKGDEACRRFLKALDAAAQALNIEPAPRTYRSHFTEKYRALFAGETRSYRVDMLEAGINLSQSPVIWANGEQYELSSAVVEFSLELQSAWAILCGMLTSWASPPAQGPVEAQAFGRTALCEAVQCVDRSWARFENAYVSEIMKVQEKAKHLVAEAIERERRLRAIEESHAEQDLFALPSYQREVRNFVGCLSRLNSVANFQRKGRDDLTVSILEGAVDVLMHCESGQFLPFDDAANAALDVAHTLASRVVESFVSLREYLLEVHGHLEQLHPQLCQNTGLVARLVEWEESWEVGARYMQSTERLSAVCRLVADIRGAQGIAPELAKMVEDYDPELFLVLPRIIWLCFLADPTKPWELMRHLLPHRFVSGDDVVDPFNRYFEGQPLRRSCSAPSLPSADRRRPSSSPRVDGELQELAKKFWGTEVRVEHALNEPVNSRSEAGAWEILIRRAVGGSSHSEDLYASLMPSRCGPAKAAVEDLMHDVERWSMELQRHCPQDWNECVSVLTQCLQGRSRQERPAEFVV